MRLFKRRNQVSPQQQNEDYLAQSSGGGSRIDWRRAAPRLLALAIILVGVVLGLLWAGGVIGKNQTTHSKTPAISRQSRPSGKPKASNKSKGTSQIAHAGSTTPSVSSPTTSSTPQSSSTPATPTTSATPAATGHNGSLTNTGPGETLAIFIVATAAGSVAYQINLRRRLN